MTIQNKSGLKAVGRAVLCKPYDPELGKTFLAIPDHVRAREMMGEMRATVVQIGANCWPDEPPRAQPGDKVLISKHCGAIVRGTADGELYRVVNDNDIWCHIEVGELDNVLVEDPIKKTKEIERTTSAAVLSVPRREKREVT